MSSEVHHSVADADMEYAATAATTSTNTTTPTTSRAHLPLHPTTTTTTSGSNSRLTRNFYPYRRRVNNNDEDEDPSSHPKYQWYHIPVLADVDTFWDTAIARLSLTDRMGATLQTIFQAGALDRAAARSLEQGGLPALYTTMLVMGGSPLRQALGSAPR